MQVPAIAVQCVVFVVGLGLQQCKFPPVQCSVQWWWWDCAAAGPQDTGHDLREEDRGGQQVQGWQGALADGGMAGV